MRRVTHPFLLYALLACDVDKFTFLQWNPSMLVTCGLLQTSPTYRSGQLMETTWHCEYWNVYRHLC